MWNQYCDLTTEGASVLDSIIDHVLKQTRAFYFFPHIQTLTNMIRVQKDNKHMTYEGTGACMCTEWTIALQSLSCGFGNNSQGWICAVSAPSEIKLQACVSSP